jgi:hypothetical protein
MDVTRGQSFSRKWGKLRVIFPLEGVNGTSVPYGKMGGNRIEDRASAGPLKLRRTDYRLAGGTMLFIRRYSTICP